MTMYCNVKQNSIDNYSTWVRPDVNREWRWTL